jgi:hypothetical protein
MMMIDTRNSLPDHSENCPLLRQPKQLGRPRIDAAIEKRIQAQLRAGKRILKVARECGQEMKSPFDGAIA